MFIEILLEKIKTHVEHDNFTFIEKIMNCVNIDKMIDFLDIKERNEIAHKFFGHKVFIVRIDDIEDTVDIQFLSYEEAKSFLEKIDGQPWIYSTHWEEFARKLFL